MDALDTILSARDLVAVLGRQVPVRLVEIEHLGMPARKFQSSGEGHDRFAAGDVRGRATTRTTSGSCAAGNAKGRATRISSGPSFCGPRTRASGRCVESSRGCRAIGTAQRRIRASEDVSFRPQAGRNVISRAHSRSGGSLKNCARDDRERYSVMRQILAQRERSDAQ